MFAFKLNGWLAEVATDRHRIAYRLIRQDDRPAAAVPVFGAWISTPCGLVLGFGRGRDQEAALARAVRQACRRRPRDSSHIEAAAAGVLVLVEEQDRLRVTA